MFYQVHDYFRNRYFDELAALSPCMRQAVLFGHITREIPQQIRDEDRIAGWYGFDAAPEMGEPRKFPLISVLTPHQRKLRTHLRWDLKTHVKFTTAHTCLDYQTVIEQGLEFYLDRVRSAREEHPEDEYLQAMELSLEAVCQYAERFGELARQRAEQSEEPQARRRLDAIARVLERVPRYGAQDFHQAVQSVWILHSLIPLAEMSWASISLGRMDQYLYPLYRKFAAEGREAEAEEILKNLFRLLDSYGDGACALNIGGMDAQGRDQMNELSRLLIRVEKQMLLRAPIFAVRVTPQTPEDILDSVVDPALFRIGQPSFYGELPCRRAMEYRGAAQEDAVNFSVNSCMGLIAAGKEFSDMWAVKFNAHLPLELAVNGGRPLNCDLGLTLNTQPEEIKEFSQLLKKYGQYFRELMGICGGLYRDIAREQAANGPDPLLSAMTEGCVESRRDRAVGAAYQTATVEMMGMGNTCDALCAIEKLVFREKRYTLAEFTEAARKNYQG